VSTLGNVIWLIFGGLLSGGGYIIYGLGMCLTIIGIPFGLQAIKIGVATLAPFGLEIREVEHSGGTLELIANVIWLLAFGWQIALVHVSMALLLGITIVGIPFATQHLKLVPLSLLPFGKHLS
jgi:uncharacterized membrane protein YccF (DUF307 family)